MDTNIGWESVHPRPYSRSRGIQSRYPSGLYPRKSAACRAVGLAKADSSAVGFGPLPACVPCQLSCPFAVEIRSWRPFVVTVTVLWSCGFLEKLNMRSERFSY